MNGHSHVIRTLTSGFQRFLSAKRFFSSSMWWGQTLIASGCFEVLQSASLGLESTRCLSTCPTLQCSVCPMTFSTLVCSCCLNSAFGVLHHPNHINAAMKCPEQLLSSMLEVQVLRVAAGRCPHSRCGEHTPQPLDWHASSFDTFKASLRMFRVSSTTDAI